MKKGHTMKIGKSRLWNSRGLTIRQEKFVLEYIKDFKGGRAALAAGYVAGSAHIEGSRNLRRPHVQAAIEQAIADRNDKLEVSARWVLKELLKKYIEICALNAADIAELYDTRGSLKPIHEWPEYWRRKSAGVQIETLEQFEMRGRKRVLTGYLTRLRHRDLNGMEARLLELIGRHVGVGAFEETINQINDVRIIVEYTKTEPRSILQQHDIPVLITSNNGSH